MINITIDGPSGAGKSTVAKAVAKKLGILYLDTGAMYRALAYSAVKSGIDVEDERAAELFLKRTAISVGYENGEQRVYANGTDVTAEIRAHAVSKAASDISKHPSVRIGLSGLQREIARSADVILDGRDAGTYVLPDANYKFFLTADVTERAKRRYADLKGAEPFEKILEDIERRDSNDSKRKLAPLKKAPDARLIDSTKMSAAEVSDFIVSVVRGGA